MTLLELVRGEKTSDKVIATAMSLAKKLKKLQFLLVYVLVLLEIVCFSLT